MPNLINYALFLLSFLDRVEGHYPFILLSFIIRIVEALGNAAFLTASFAIIAKEFPDNVATTFVSSFFILKSYQFQIYIFLKLHLFFTKRNI